MQRNSGFDRLDREPLLAEIERHTPFLSSVVKCIFKGLQNSPDQDKCCQESSH